MSGFSAAASLTASLLARKGAAMPMSFAPRLATISDAPRETKPRLPRPVAAPAPSEGRTPRKRQSLRLDDRRHLQLRLIAAHLGKSRQELLVEALDEFLERNAGAVSGGNCACLAGGMPGGACDAMQRSGADHDQFSDPQS